MLFTELTLNLAESSHERVATISDLFSSSSPYFFAKLQPEEEEFFSPYCAGVQTEGKTIIYA